MRIGGILYVLGFFSSMLTAQQPGSASLQSELSVQVVEGDGAINSIRFHRGHEPKVRVVSSSGEPVSEAAVTFLLPASGPSGTFGDSGLSLTVPTDSRGFAVGRGFRPNSVPGQFRIRVTTMWKGLPATAALVQTNAEPVVHTSHSKTIAIIAVIAGAGIGGAVAAASHKSGSTTPNSTTVSTVSTGGSIVSGSPSIGPPH